MLAVMDLGEAGPVPITQSGDTGYGSAEYMFHAEGSVLASVSVMARSPEADFAIAIYDASTPDSMRQRQVLYNDDASAATKNPAGDWVVPAGGGTYRLVVSSRDTKQNPDFQISLSGQDSRFVLPAGMDGGHRSLTLAASGVVHLAGDSPLGGAAQLALYDASGNLVTTSGASGVFGRPVIDQFLLPGSYFLTSSTATNGSLHVNYGVTAAAQPIDVITTGDYPTSVAVGDVNGDKETDIVTANHLSDTVSVMLGNGDGSFWPQQEIAVGAWPQSVTLADMNGDHLLDVVTVNSEVHDVRSGTSVSILLGRGDGSFTPSTTFTIGTESRDVVLGTKSIVAEDLDHDGHMDLVLAHSGSYNGDSDVGNTLTVLMGSATGSFTQRTIPVGYGPCGLAVVDVNSDTLPDIITANSVSGTVTVLLACGGGEFCESPSSPYTVETVDATNDLRPLLDTNPAAVSVADVNRDDRVDIVTTGGNNTIVVLIGQPHDTFTARTTVPLEHRVSSLTTIDFNRDRWVDVAASSDDGFITILLGDGSGGFHVGDVFESSGLPKCLATADFDKDGSADLVTANYYNDNASVLLGRGDGSFIATQGLSFSVAKRSEQAELCMADFNGDGRIDLLKTDDGSEDLTVLIGSGDGTFFKRKSIGVGPNLGNVAAADVNVDGRMDLVSAKNDGIRVLLGVGDGTFMAPKRVVSLSSLETSAVSDFNGDGVPDVAVFLAGEYHGDEWEKPSVSVLLGDGTGSFTLKSKCYLEYVPECVAPYDVDGDGDIDVVLYNYPRSGIDVIPPNDITTLLGNGKGDLSIAFHLDTGRDGASIAVGDFTGDGRIDVVTFNDGWTICEGDGQGGFTKGLNLGVVTSPGDGYARVNAADMNNDGHCDIIIAGYFDSGVYVLLSNGDGSFSVTRRFDVGLFPARTAIGDLNNDGRLDVVTRNLGSGDITVLLCGDDGVLDGFSEERGVTLSAVSSRFFTNAASQAVSAALLNANSSLDALAINRDGNLVVRYDTETITHGLQLPLGPPGIGTLGMAFDSTVLAAPALPSRIAAIDNRRDTLFIGTPRSDGDIAVSQVLRAAAKAAPTAPTAVLSRLARATGYLGDLNADGYDDIVVSDPGSGTIDLLVTGAGGLFNDTQWQRLAGGGGPIDVFIVDVNRDGAADLVTSNQVSGDVSVRLGIKGIIGTRSFTAATGFGAEYRYRTSSRVYGYDTDPYSGRGTAIAPQKLTSIALGDVNGDGFVDLVATSSQDRSFSILLGLRGQDGLWAGFGPPQRHAAQAGSLLAPIVATGATSVEDVAIGDFDADGYGDVALLDRRGERILLYESRSNPKHERPATVIPLTGNLPRSLLVADSTGPKGVPDGVLDILVGNDYGDVLVLQGKADVKGKGTGEFETVVRTDKSVALMAADIDGDGKDDFVYGNKGLDRVTINRTATKQSFEADQKQGVIGPSAVATVVETVGGRQIKNLVVANGGANQIMLFSRNMDAATNASDIFLPPQRFFVGTNPSAVSVADVNQDGIPDVVVANGGSNDISVMLGTMSDGRWTMKAGPRLAAGGTNPAGVAVGDFVTGSGSPGKDGIPDIAVTNRGSNSANIIAGRGQGFFNDQVPVPLVLPPNAQPGPIFATPGRVGIGNIGANSVTLFDTTRRGAGTESFASRTYSSGGGSPSSLATYTSGGTTYLAVGNLSGSVSLFLGRAGPLEFSLQNSFTLPNVTGLAFDSTGRLFGMSPARESALQLFAFEGQASGPTIANSSLAALGAAVFYVPLRASAVALVATIVSSGAVATGTAAAGEGDAKAVPLNAEEKGEGDAADGGSAEGDGSGQKRDAAQPGEDGTESKTAEDPAAAGLKLFLDIDKTLKANNGRLLETLLDGRSGDAGEAGEPDREAAEPDRAAGEAAESVPRPDERLAVWRKWAEVEGHRDTEAGPRAAGWPGSTVEMVVPVAFVFPATTADAACVRIPPWTSARKDEPAPSQTRQRRRQRRQPVHNLVASGLTMDRKPPT